MGNAIAAFLPLLLAQLPLDASAQSAAAEGWTRVTSPDQSYSVEVPCSADEITHVPPPQIQRQEGDDRASVNCASNAEVYFANRVSVAVDVQLPGPLFDLMRASVTSAELGSNVSFVDLTVSQRRVLRSRETTAEGLVGQTDIVEIDDRNALLLVARTASRVPPSLFENQVSHFAASFEVVP